MTNDITTGSPISIETPLTRKIKLILFSVPLGPSLLCSLYIIICCIHNRNMRRRSNHVMILIITIDFIELMCDLVPISLNYFHKGHTFSISVCHYWAVGNYLLQGISSWLMAWASIDRYLLIFMPYNQDTFLRHDAPLLGVSFSVIIWYIIVTLTHSCNKTWLDGYHFLCGGPCFNDNLWLVTADWILIVLLPTFLIVVFNALLLGRVILQDWGQWSLFNSRSFMRRKNKMLIIQLLSVIIVYLVTQFPLAIFSIVRLLGPSNFLIDVSLIWLFYTPYLIYIFVPFAYVATTKECQKYLRKPKQRVRPVILAISYRPKDHSTFFIN